MGSFPTSVVAPTDPTSGNTLNSPDHAGEHQSHNAEIVAVETKIGTGASTPTAGKVLRASGTGTSAWAQVDPSTDVATLSSATLRSLLTDETGTGVAVFGTAPALGSPVITTPGVVISINDSNGNEIIKTPATASATNEITVTNAATGSAPAISATGSSDSNIDLIILGKGTGSARHAGPYDGWVAANETLTYASATTFTTASAGLAAALAVGDRIKLTQTTVKYFNVVGISGTTITVTGGTDYTLANAAITLPYYSKNITPTGFPQWFAFTPTTTTGWSATPTTSGSRFCIKGRECTYRFIVSGTSNATSVQISLPVNAQASVTTGTFNFEGVLGLSQDNSSFLTVAARQVVDPTVSLSLLVCYHDMSSGVWTNSGSKTVRGTAIYEI